MKMKFILGWVAAAVISSPVMAIQVTNGKVISHKEWSTKGVQASYLNPVTAKVTSHGATYVKAGIRPAQVALGQSATLVNDNYMYLRNDSTKTHRYYVNSDVCILTDENNQECVYSSDVVELDAGGDVVQPQRPALTVTLTRAGEYPVYAGAFIYDASGDRAANAQSHATLTVN